MKRPSPAYAAQESSTWKIWAAVAIGVLVVVYLLSPTSGSALRGNESLMMSPIPPKTSAHLSEVLGVALELSKKSAKIIQDVKKAHEEHSKVKGHTEEGVAEPVTEADAMSNANFVNGMRSRFEGVHILSEEANPEFTAVYSKSLGKDVAKHLAVDPILDMSDILITVDPLDATKEFTEDLLNYVTTMVCISQNGRPIAGLIDQPFEEGDAIWGVVPEVNGGHGVVRGVKPTKASGDLENVVTISRSHTGDAANVVEQYLEGKTALLAGGSGFKSLLLLRGEAEAYVHMTRIKVWDVCAADAVVHAAGGEFTDSYGKSIEYKHDDPYITTGLTATLDAGKHPWYIEKLSHRTGEAV